MSKQTQHQQGWHSAFFPLCFVCLALYCLSVAWRPTSRTGALPARLLLMNWGSTKHLGPEGVSLHFLSFMFLAAQLPQLLDAGRQHRPASKALLVSCSHCLCPRADVSCALQLFVRAGDAACSTADLSLSKVGYACCLCTAFLIRCLLLLYNPFGICMTCNNC